MAFTRRPSRSGTSMSPPRTAGPDPPFPGRPFSQWNRRPSSSRFANTPSCGSTTACMPCRPRFRSLPALRCIVVWSVTAPAVCPRSRVTSLVRKKLDTYPISFFHIDLAEVRTAKANSSCSSPSTALRSSLWSNSSKSQHANRHYFPQSSDPSCPRTASTQC